ncbi:MAG TPA: hypothetical protein VFS75_00330 [Candidatus Paceibacterota bacterium]|nr:hypothetical protein [Candidatus Paceibacterota bacterium]
MNHIIPAIIPESFQMLEAALSTVRGFGREAQIDVVDGAFVPARSWPFTEGDVSDLARLSPAFILEADLMVEAPEDAIPGFSRFGVRKMVVHAESVRDWDRIREQRAKLGFSLGLSILNDSPLSLLLDRVSHIDYVQLMGIKTIGVQGEPFDERVLERICAVRAQHPDLMISVDGSVNETTLPKLIEAGADRFVVGSAIFDAPNPAEAYGRLTRIEVL